MEYTYSVIIPHKNCQDLLGRCLKSIPKRPDIQIIIVDDNSDPDKVDFELLLKLDSGNTTVVLDKQAKGAGAARNIGLKIATGRWLVFSDSDDFFTEGAFDEMDKYSNSDYDIVYFKMDSVYSDTFKPANRGDFVNKLIDSYIANPANEDGLRYKFINPVCKMIKTSLVINNNITFDEVIASNDEMFSVKTGHAAKRISASNFKVYCATITKGSLINTISAVRSRTRFEVAIRKNRFLIDIGKRNLQQRLLSDYLHSVKYGIKEWWLYTKTLLTYNINPLWGLGGFLLSVIRKLFRKKKKSSYIVYTNE